MASFSHGPMRGKAFVASKDVPILSDQNRSLSDTGLLSDLDSRRGWTVLAGSESLIAGAGAGLISSIVTCPLDVVKTRLQAFGGIPRSAAGVRAGAAQGMAEAAPAVTGLVGTVRHIWHNEGIRGLYRGLAPTIYGYLPTWAIYFTVYDRVKAKLNEKRGNAKGQADPVVHVLAAMSGGATGTIVTNPLWVIKTRVMVSLSISRLSRGF